LVYVGAGEALLEAIPHNAIAVEAQKAVGSADPDEAVLILQDARWGHGTEAEAFADALKHVVGLAGQGKRGRLGGLCLSGNGTERQNDQDNQEKGGGSLVPHEHSGRCSSNSLACG
jgi:hypothetical protein